MSKNIFSRIAFKMLEWLCPPHLYEEIEGDLLQQFNRDLLIYGGFGGHWRLSRNVIFFLRPGILLRNRFNMSSRDFIMFIANIRIAFRIIKKQKLFSAINIAGLSICMAACMLIFQYAYYESTYDTQHVEFKNIYRISTTLFENGEVRYPSALSNLKDGPTLESRLPEVVATARLIPNNWFDCTLAYNDGDELKIFNENQLYYADASLLAILYLPLVSGNNEIALTKPYSIVLSESAARKYFGDKIAIGKTMHIKGSGEDHDYTVTAVMKELPHNTHLRFNILASANSLLDKNNSIPNQPYTYVRFENGKTPNLIQDKLSALAGELYPSDGRFSTTINFQPVADIHLYSKLQDEIKPGGDIKDITFLLLAASVVMCIAWGNFVNLNSSRSIMRGKEVGVRKAIGASRKQITVQFLTETVVTLAISIALAALIIYFFGNTFLNFTGLTIDRNLLWSLNPAWYWILIFLVSGLAIAAYFPARIMSSINPSVVLKGKLIFNFNGLSFKRIALVFQFSCAIILTTAVIMFNQQFNYMGEQDLNVEIGNTLILRNPSNVDSLYLQRLGGFKNELKNLAIINSLSSSTSVPGQNIGWTGVISNEKSGLSKDCRIHVIDNDFIKTYQLKILAGRDFETNDFPGKHFGHKLEPVILNESAVSLLGYDTPEDIIGKNVYWDANQCLVVGVIEDFHQESLKETIKPTFFTANMGPSLSVKLTNAQSNDRARALETIQSAWKHYFPNNPFDYSFLEEDFNKQYASDRNVAATINIFSSLAIVITIVGLFALSMFSLNQRVKEVGIRKVLGASGIHLFKLLTQEYVRLIIIASLVSIPLAHWLVTRWLDSFAFHVEISPWLHLIPVTFVFAVALLTIGGQTLKLIIRNPANALKHE